MLTKTPAAAQYFLALTDLPACCPRPDMPLWNAHPRVYLPLEERGHALCPYCSAEYFVMDLYSDTEQNPV